MKIPKHHQSVAVGIMLAYNQYQNKRHLKKHNLNGMMPKSSSMGPIERLNPAPPLTQQGMRPNIARDRIELINMFNQYRMQREDPYSKVESSKQ